MILSEFSEILAVKQQKTRERFNLITKKVEKYSSYDYIKFITSKSLKNKQKERSLANSKLKYNKIPLKNVCDTIE